jgi:hypothetical protein
MSHWAREIGLLRTLAVHLERRPSPIGRVTQDLLRREGLGYAREKAGEIICIRMPGHHALTELTDCLFDRISAMERGAVYADVKAELFNFTEPYLDRDPSTVGSKDVELLVAHFQQWFAGKALARRVFVPCVISRTAAPRFEIGPVAFEFINRVTKSDFYPHDSEEAAFDQIGFDGLLQWMQTRDADWLARVSVDNCEQKRAEEIAELAVDLTIVALQLAAPHLDTRSMARLDARRGTSQKGTISEAGGHQYVGWARKEPGLAIGAGTLEDILQKVAPVFTAVGNVVRSFASGSFRLPVLESAWCDAAYWLHQALAESVDAIAMAELETALEVLLRSESTRGSEHRMLEILSVFFDLGPDDPLAPGSSLSARQFARRVVRDRSRILHGTSSTLNARGIDRGGMEGFVVTVLRSAVLELEAYSQSVGPADDVDVFLGWVRRPRMTSTPVKV